MPRVDIFVGGAVSFFYVAQYMDRIAVQSAGGEFENRMGQISQNEKVFLFRFNAFENLAHYHLVVI
jgi:hypothetical protein